MNKTIKYETIKYITKQIEAMYIDGYLAGISKIIELDKSEKFASMNSVIMKALEEIPKLEK